MDTISALVDFIEKARGERKYAESTARGYTAAVKLFAAYVSDQERQDFDVLLQNIENIAADIYAKQADENITVTTLVVYKRRMRKLVQDYREYGSSPDKLAAWNPRRPAKGLGGGRRSAGGADSAAVQLAGEDSAQVLLQPSRVSTSNQAGVVALDGGEDRVIMNRSEISLRSNLRIALELPADMTAQEADKIKQLIDIMLPPQ